LTGGSANSSYGQCLRGNYPDYPAERARATLDMLMTDLDSRLSGEFSFQRNVERQAKDSSRVTIPILATRLSDRKELWIALSSPIAPEVPIDFALRQITGWPIHSIFCLDDLLVRQNLPGAVGRILEQFSLMYSLALPKRRPGSDGPQIGIRFNRVFPCSGEIQRRFRRHRPIHLRSQDHQLRHPCPQRSIFPELGMRCRFH
jgi:hypothetical protein